MSRKHKGNTRVKCQSNVEGVFMWFHVNTLRLSAHEITNLYKLRAQPHQGEVIDISDDTGGSIFK